MQVLREVLRVKVGEEQEQDLWQRLKGLYQPLVSDVPGVFRELLELNGMPSSRRAGDMYTSSTSDGARRKFLDARRALDVLLGG